MILIGLGANLPSELGDPRETLGAALSMLAAQGVVIEARSRWYRTPPMGPQPQPAFVNAAARLGTQMGAEALLALLHRTEAALGRVRAERWGARAVDLDLLDYHGRIENQGGVSGLAAGNGPIPLSLPHPGIPERAFVLVPLLDIAPGWTHPVSGLSVAQMLEKLGNAADLGIESISD